MVGPDASNTKVNGLKWAMISLWAVHSGTSTMIQEPYNRITFSPDIKTYGQSESTTKAEDTPNK